ncbi:reverse transcriptase [Elysia marginata]|uniref:Reverse transcriptase n=1 Tax=Elysia marginata TaxID=1093978 RepID=A0AAV4HW86_9GAST|nr:reverse transcriptase [Elysia marginata]
MMMMMMIIIIIIIITITIIIIIIITIIIIIIILTITIIIITIIIIISSSSSTIFPEDILDYQSVKKTLLRRFGCDKNGFKSKFFFAKPSMDEDFATYINRVARYFNHWLELAQVSDFDSLSFLIPSEIALQPCDAEFVSYIKDHSPTSLSDMKTRATSYLNARQSKSFTKASTTSFAGASVRHTVRPDSRRSFSQSYRSPSHRRVSTPSLGRHTSHSHTSSGHRPPTHGVHSFAGVILGDIDAIAHPTTFNSHSGVDDSVPSACIITQAQARKITDDGSQHTMAPSNDSSPQS